MTCGWTVASVPLSGFKFSLMDAGKLVSALSPHLSLFLSPLCAGLNTTETMFIQTTGSKLEDKVFVFFTDFPVTFAFSFLFKVDSHFFPLSHTDWESFMTTDSPSLPYPIFNVGFPSNRHVAQVKEFNVSVVVSSTHTAILFVEGMACHEKAKGSPTVII